MERRASYAGRDDGQEPGNKKHSLNYAVQMLRGKVAMVIWHRNIRRVTPKRVAWKERESEGRDLNERWPPVIKWKSKIGVHINTHLNA